MLVGLALGTFLSAFPTYYRLLLFPCAGPNCMPDQLLPQAALAAAGISIPVYAALNATVIGLHAFIWSAVGLFLFWRKSDDWMALLMGLFLVLYGTHLRSDLVPYPSLSAAWWLWQILSGFAWAAFYAAVCLFPNGRFTPRWMSILLLITLVLQIFETLPAEWPLSFTNWPPLLVAILILLVWGLAIFSLINRYVRRSSWMERQQIKWVLYGMILYVAVGLVLYLLTFISPGLRQAGSLYQLGSYVLLNLVGYFVPLSIGIAVMRFRIWDIDPIINRTLVYGLLTSIVIGSYILIVGYLGAVFKTGQRDILSLVATGLVAVLFQPLRQRVQQGINRLMYGQIDDPYAVITRLGQQLEGTVDLDQALLNAVTTIKEAFKLPYASIFIKDTYPGHFQLAAGIETPGEAVSIPILYLKDEIGRLVLKPRSEGESFSRSETRLFTELARQIGIVVHNNRLSADLQHAHEQLILGVEEERRRLRGDLHDGLGPALATLSMKLEAGRDLVDVHPAEAKDVLNEAVTDTQAIVADVRRLVYALRPPALDALGLIGAIEQHLAAYEHSGVTVRFNAPDQLPTLPAAIEVAAYRIILEALNNVFQHSRAKNCQIQINCQAHELLIEIQDDGQGLPERYQAGVGLHSMRERAASLGGKFNVENRKPGGVWVNARLPFA